MNPANRATPFKPISKAAAAEVLGVSTKTIDNYIKAGLLPAPRPFGGRELWHPDVFYARLHNALMPLDAGQSDAPAIAPAVPRAEARAASREKRADSRVRDLPPLARQKERQARRLSAMNREDEP